MHAGLHQCVASGHIDGNVGAQQDFRYGVFRRALRPGVAADADALLAAAHPEPTMLGLDGASRAVAQFHAQRLLAGHVQEE